MLKDLVFNPHVKNKDLEEKYGLSRHQVGYSINKINSWLTSNNLPVIERAKNGFFIIQTEVRSYFKMDHQAEAAGQPYIFSENERAELILLMILSKREELSLIHFTSALCVSKNTILNDLEMAQTLLQPHGLEVGYSRQSGYEMIGSEIQKRKFLIHLVQRILEKEHGEWALESVKEIHKQRKVDIQQWLEQVEQQLNLTFTDEKMKQLPYILAITLERIEQFERIDAAFCIHYEELSDTKEYQAVELLLQGDEAIPREERLLIALNLLASNVSSYEVLTDTDLPELVKAVETTLHLFEKNACIELKEKENLTRLIFSHMKPAYYRIKYHLATSNQYAEKIDSEFGELHFLIKQSIAPLEELIGEAIPESEIVYLTMFMGGWLERQGGGAAGIGRQIALDFAEKGCCTAVADIDQSVLTDMTQQNQVHGFKADVSSWASVSEMIEQVIDEMGSIDTLVFSAGITKKGDLEETDWALWEKTIAVNLHGLFFSIKAAAPHMMGRKKGKIVIIGSGSAITGSGGGIQYYASKGGAFGLMRSLVKELGEHRININVIAPRVIESQMLDSLYPTDELKQTVRSKIPIGRLGRPSDISERVQYLSSAQADYIHGQIFLLDGGRTYQGNR